MNKKLYVGNLATAAEENQLQALFSADGRRVVSVKILIDPKTKRSRGYAFVEMATEGDAESAIEALQGKQLMGRPLAVNEARESGNSSAEEPFDLARFKTSRKPSPDGNGEGRF